ncbi:MAG: phospho-N-acetylmuramoyl-pentapeptide-transferase [Treponema lecithinolyticum]|uniref:phospho-N-acetylmuramoyl-pentapeptide- transferase n=1 Tax=Treponema lecithinolyticum TaxID=53418 RepID=UPI0036097EA7
MLYYFAFHIMHFFGPGRLLQSYAVLISVALYTGFALMYFLLPRCYRFLPVDRGREFTINAEAAKGKPTGSGVVFISAFTAVTLICAPLDVLQAIILGLTWLTMLSGYLDDRSNTGWGEYKKGLLDLVLSLAASFALYHITMLHNHGAGVRFWLPFVAGTVNVPAWVYIPLATVLLWASINTTNCTDGVDGLSSTLVLIALITMGVLFYFVLGHKDIAAYLLIPHLSDGASWAVIVFSLAGVLMGYLWHNAYPSKVLMGDAGSRALGFFIGVCVMVSGNPFLFFATSSIIFLNGGMGLLKVALLRFFKIRIFDSIRFPLHDHMRKNRGWSPTQVLVKFMILQVLVTIAVLGIILKVR